MDASAHEQSITHDLHKAEINKKLNISNIGE